MAPSNQRQWTADQRVLPYVTATGREVNVHNVRNCGYVTEEDYVVDHYDKTVNIDELESVDFIVVPFKGMPALAHTMLSFGFKDGYYLCVSVEIRKETDESFATWKSALRQYELMYVVGDERDLVKLRTNIRHEDVYVYPVRATPEQARELFVDVMDRVNKLYEKPEFYDPLTNNCTTNIVRHINKLKPDRVPYTWRVMLPGYSDSMAYDLGLLRTQLPFSKARQEAYVTDKAERFADRPDFSAVIRR